MSNQYQLTIQGMHCSSCENKIRDALAAIDGLITDAISAKSGIVTLHAPTNVSEQTLRVAIEGAGSYRVTSIEQSDSDAPAKQDPHQSDSAAHEEPDESLYPLFLIVGFIAGVTMLVAWSTQRWELQPMMRHFMAGFFIVFSFFKLLDPPGFVSAYRGYDLIARKSATWAWIYPFVELGLGVMYLMAWAPVTTNTITLILMLVGAAGVLKALLNKQAIRCACLGTALNLPMTKVTLVEDLTMAFMAAAMLVLIL
ncbi:MAG: cation transporter [Phycisphaerales bacterium]|nr:cation transporter [Phycisphaerales bacterium]